MSTPTPKVRTVTYYDYPLDPPRVMQINDEMLVRSVTVRIADDGHVEASAHAIYMRQDGTPKKGAQWSTWPLGARRGAEFIVDATTRHQTGDRS